jgi:hypothetical protein
MVHRGGGTFPQRRPPLALLLATPLLLLSHQCHAQWDMINVVTGLPLGAAANAAVCAAVSPSPGEDTATLSARCTAAFAALTGSTPGSDYAGPGQGVTPSSSSASSDTSSGTNTWWSSTTDVDAGSGRNMSSSSSSSDWLYEGLMDQVQRWLLRMLAQGEEKLGEDVLRDVCDPGNDLNAPSCIDEVVAVTHAYTGALVTAPASQFAPPATCDPKTTGAAGAKGVDGAMMLLSATLCSRGSATSSVTRPTQPYCLLTVGAALNTSGILGILAHQLQPNAPPLDPADVKRVCPSLAATGCCATGLLTAMQRAAQLTCSPQSTQLASAISLVKVTCAIAGTPLAPAPCDDLAAANSRLPPAPSAAMCATLRSLSQPPEAPLCALQPGDCPVSGCDLYCSPAPVAMPYYDKAGPTATPASATKPPSSPTTANASPAAFPRRRRRGGVGAAVAVTLLVVVVALCLGTAFLRRHARLGMMGSSLNALVRGQNTWWAGGGYQPPTGEGYEMMVAEEEGGGLLLPK